MYLALTLPFPNYSVLQFNEGDVDDVLSSGDDETEDEQHCSSAEAVDLSSLTLKDKVFFIFFIQVSGVLLYSYECFE